MIMVSPIVSLQAPKDVSIDEIEAELRSLWQTQGSDEDAAAVTRAATFSLIIYEPDGTQQVLASLGFYTGPIDGIAGPRTKAAIKAAQKDYGMEATGKSDDKLIEKLQAEFVKAKTRRQINFRKQNRSHQL